MAGLGRGTKNVIYINDLRLGGNLEVLKTGSEPEGRDRNLYDPGKTINDSEAVFHSEGERLCI